MIFLSAKQSVKLPNVAPVKFVKEVQSELKKVTWPTRDSTIKLTVVVIGVSLAVGLFIGGLDTALVQLSRLIFK